MDESIVKGQRFVGLDVHAESITVAVAEKDGEVRCLETIPNRVKSHHIPRPRVKRIPYLTNRLFRGLWSY